MLSNASSRARRRRGAPLVVEASRCAETRAGFRPLPSELRSALVGRWSRRPIRWSASTACWGPVARPAPQVCSCVLLVAGRCSLVANSDRRSQWLQLGAARSQPSECVGAVRQPWVDAAVGPGWRSEGPSSSKSPKSGHTGAAGSHRLLPPIRCRSSQGCTAHPKLIADAERYPPHPNPAGPTVTAASRPDVRPTPHPAVAPSVDLPTPTLGSRSHSSQPAAPKA